MCACVRLLVVNCRYCRIYSVRCFLCCFTVTFCSLSVCHKLVSLEITIENGAIKFIKRSRMHSANIQLGENSMYTNDETTIRKITNIIKVKHRLYYSLQWNCFLLNVMLVSTYIESSVSHSATNDDGRYVVFFDASIHVYTLYNALWNSSSSCVFFLLVAFIFTLCVLFVCLPISCLSLSISFAWKKPVFIASVYFFLY